MSGSSSRRKGATAERYVAGLDLGTTVGVCRATDDGAGWEFALAEQSFAGRDHASVVFREFREWVRGEILTAPDLVVYEKVTFARGRGATIINGQEALLLELCESNGIPFYGVAVPTLKKYATGKGNAKKGAMKAAAAARLGRDDFTDNEADAFWCAEYGCSEIVGALVRERIW